MASQVPRSATTGGARGREFQIAYRRTPVVVRKMDDREYPSIWTAIAEIAMPMIGGAIIVALFTKPVMLAMFRAVAIIVGLASGPAFILLVVRSLNSRDAQNRGEQKSSASVGFFGRNEFASIGFSAFALCVMAVLFPPWVKVRADWAMSGFGFGSHEVKVHETHFAGYD